MIRPLKPKMGICRGSLPKKQIPIYGTFIIPTPRRKSGEWGKEIYNYIWIVAWGKGFVKIA
jgi:hypothetical protein